MRTSQNVTEELSIVNEKVDGVFRIFKERMLGVV